MPPWVRILPFVLLGVATLALTWGGLSGYDTARAAHCAGSGRIFTELRDPADVAKAVTGAGGRCVVAGVTAAEAAEKGWTEASLPISLAGGTVSGADYELSASYRWRDGYTYTESLPAQVGSRLLILYGLLAMVSVASVCGLEWRR